MKTYNERREVARRLRAYGKEFGDPTWRELCNVVFWDEDSYPTAVRKLHLIDRLADLIDPGDMSQGRRDIVACDRDALLRLARYMDKDVAETEAHFSNVISTKSVSDYARRIRKALGVES